MSQTSLQRAPLPVFLLGLGLVTAHGQHELCPLMEFGPTIADTTAASCVYDAATQSAVITLNQDAVLQWDRVNQEEGSSLVFQFEAGSNGNTVLNRLGSLPAGQRHIFDGALTSNGRVVIVSPTSEVKIGGSVTASEFIAVVSDLSATDQAALLTGSQSVLFESSANEDLPGSRLLTVSGGQITATSGDVVLGAAQLVNISASQGTGGTIQSAGTTRVFSGSSVRYDPTVSSGEALTPFPTNESSAILHTGQIEAGSDIEMRVGDGGQLLVTGGLKADGGAGRIFLRVKDGEIDLHPNTNLAGLLETSGELASVLYEGSESDTPGARSPAVSLFPALRKKGEAGKRGERSDSVQVIEGAPVTASAQAKRTSKEKGNGGQVAKEKASSRSGGALVQRSGFFGLRSAQVSRRQREEQ